jgi:hypothetical protein
VERTEYLVRLKGLSSAEIGQAARRVLATILDDGCSGETDIPWARRAEWPPEVVAAAVRLQDQFVKESKHGDEYLQTNVQSLAARTVREDFALVAPYAYDATFWGDDRTIVASLSDEGTAFSVLLTGEQRNAVAGLVGDERVVSLRDWRKAHPTALRWLVALLKPHRA